MIKSLKHRKPIVYISLSIYLLLIVFIIFESCIPSGLSGTQSNFFAQISAWIVNIINGPQVPNSIAPLSFGDITDTTYLGKDDKGNSQIAIGTTSLITIPIKYPTKPNDYDVYNKEYTLSYPLGNKDDYNVVLSSRTNKDIYYIEMRVVANNLTNDLYQIDVNVADTLTYNYKFNIVPLATPTSYECKISKTNLKIGETSKITTKLLDPNRDDAYLRRYLDESLITRNSSNEEIAAIDKYGVIHALKEGDTKIIFGTYSYDIHVANESIIKSTDNFLSLTKDSGSKEHPSLLDYDYVFAKDENPNDYSCLVKASFDDVSLEDKTVSWELDDNLKAKISPYKYDEDGYPVYEDDNGVPCVRVCGYRKKGEVKLTCVSNVDNNAKKEITLNVDEALPTTMSVNVKNNTKVYVNDQLTINGTFGPKNVNNKNIHVDVDNSNLVKIKNNNSSSVTITGVDVGTIKLTIKSIANPELVKEINVEFTAKSAIDDGNYNDFHKFIRKAAGHFSLFLVTAIFGMIFFYTFIDDIKKLWLSIALTSSIGLFTAGLSELIQWFIPSRTGNFIDVGIDFLGYIIGIVITISIALLVRFLNRRKKHKQCD